MRPATSHSWIAGGAVFVLGLGVLAGCEVAPTPIPAPTITLMRVTATPTLLPVTPPRVSSLPAPGDLLTPTNADAATATGEAADPSLLAADPIAAELAAIARRRIAEQRDLPLARVQLVEVEAVRWTDNSLGCPAPDQTYTAGFVDGYRIVISAGDTLYLFHTDFDQIVPCDPERERLPGNEND